MPIVQDDILRLVWKYKVDGVQTRGINTFYWKVTDLVSGDDSDVTDEMFDSINGVYDDISAHLSADYISEEIRITNATKREFVGDKAGTYVGTGAAGASMPGQVAVEILGRARKLGHVARKYLGPPIEAALDDGVLTAGAKTDFTTWMTNYVTLFIGNGPGNTYQPVMVKFAAGGAVASHEELDPDLGFVVDTARTQRSRTPGVGLT